MGHVGVGVGHAGVLWVMHWWGGVGHVGVGGGVCHAGVG